MANVHGNFCHKISEQFDSIEEDLGRFQNLFRKKCWKNFEIPGYKFLTQPFSIKRFSKNTDHENIDKKRDKKCQSTFDKEIFIGFFDLFDFFSVNFSRFDQGRMKINIVWHNNSTNNSDSLNQWWRAAILAMGNQNSENSFDTWSEKFPPIWNILIDVLEL